MTRGTQVIVAVKAGAGRRFWPEKLLGPAPGLKELNLASWGLLAAMLILKVGVPLWIQLKTRVPSLQILPADFIYFYGIGSIAHHYPLARLYDYNLQLRTFNAIYALHDQAYGPSPYPPFVALFFSLFARLRFGMAFALWAIVSLALYLAGIVVVAKEAFPGERLKQSLAICFSLSFYPFLIGTLANGQLAAFAVCAVSLAFVADRRGMPLACGVMLSLLAYKPTLLLLLVPMLVVTRRFKALAGFVAGVFFLVLVATAFGGLEVWQAYIRFVSLFGKVAGLGDRSGLPLSKFVDLGSCLQLAAGGPSAAGSAIWMSIAGAVFAALVVLWWKSAGAGRTAQTLVWATTLTWTLLINVYVPVYDSSLAAVATILTVGALAALTWNAAASWIFLLAIFSVAASWFTSEFALTHRIQILSIAICVLGLAQLGFLYRAMAEKRPPATAGDALPSSADA